MTCRTLIASLTSSRRLSKDQQSVLLQVLSGLFFTLCTLANRSRNSPPSYDGNGIGSMTGASLMGGVGSVLGATAISSALGTPVLTPGILLFL